MFDYDLARQRLQAKGEQYKKHRNVFQRIFGLFSQVTAHEHAPPALQAVLEISMRREAAALDEIVANLQTEGAKL